MVRDEETYPLGTIVRLRETGEFAILLKKSFMQEGQGFMNYLAKIDGKGEGLYTIYHEDIELVVLPPDADA